MGRSTNVECYNIYVLADSLPVDIAERILRFKQRLGNTSSIRL